MPARTARPAERRKKRDSVIGSSVWKPTSTPAFSRTAPVFQARSMVSSFPPGLSTLMIEQATPAAAISSATFQASLTWWRVTRKPNSFWRRSTVTMSSCRCVWWWTMRLPSITSSSPSIPRSRAGSFLGSSPASLIFCRYSWALTYCSRTRAADLARVPGKGGLRREFVPLAIFIPPRRPVLGLGRSRSSTTLPSRSFR